MCGHPLSLYLSCHLPLHKRTCKSFNVSNGGVACNGVTLPQTTVLWKLDNTLNSIYKKGLPDAARDSTGGDPHFYSFSQEGTPQSMWYRVARTQVESLSV